MIFWEERLSCECMRIQGAAEITHRGSRFPFYSPQARLRNVILKPFRGLTQPGQMSNQVQHDDKLCLFAFMFVYLLFFMSLVGCQKVEKPELRGQGPLAVVVPRGSTAPEYHAPIERWRVIHMEAINRGDFDQRQCVLCHDPKTSCNRCHQYIGAKLVAVSEADLYWPAQTIDR